MNSNLLSKLVLAVDLDNVVFATIPYLAESYNQEFNAEVHLEDRSSVKAQRAKSCKEVGVSCYES